MKLLKLLRDKRGAGSIEYSLVASLIAIAAISGYQNLGFAVGDTYDVIESKL